VVVVMAVIGWQVISAAPELGGILMLVSLVGTLVLGIVNAVKRQVSPPLILVYGLASGFMLGAVSYWYDQIGLAYEYEGLVLQAVIATFTTFGVMLLLFGTGIVKVNSRFMKVMLVAMVSYFFIAMASLVAALFGVGGGWGFTASAPWACCCASSVWGWRPLASCSTLKPSGRASPWAFPSGSLGGCPSVSWSPWCGCTWSSCACSPSSLAGATNSGPAMTDGLEVEVGRLADRLRSMPLTKLSAPWQESGSRAAAARELAQRMANDAADLAGVPRRGVPDVGDAAVGDQVAVVGAELVLLNPPADVVDSITEDLRRARLTF